MLSEFTFDNLSDMLISVLVNSPLAYTWLLDRGKSLYVKDATRIDNL